VAHLGAKQQTGIIPLGLYITAQEPSMAHLLDVARAIFGPPGIFDKVHNMLYHNHHQLLTPIIW